MMKRLKKNSFLVFVAIVYIGLFAINGEKAILSIKNSGYYIKEMLTVMPLVFLLTALIDTWIPQETIMDYLGDESGLRGSFISIFLGSVSAGPIYAAFPVCKTLLQKGASISNIVVILSSWAVIKIPMLANEAKFLSPKFMAVRWIFTTIGIIIMGYMVSKVVKRDDIPIEEKAIELGKILIKEEYCIGCGICAKMAPEHFKIENNKAIIIDENIHGEIDGDVDKAEQKCPTKAIEVGRAKEFESDIHREIIEEG